MSPDELAAWRATRISTSRERLCEELLGTFAHAARGRNKKRRHLPDFAVHPPYRPPVARPFCQVCLALEQALKDDGTTKGHRDSERWIVGYLMRVYPPDRFSWFYDLDPPLPPLGENETLQDRARKVLQGKLHSGLASTTRL